MTSDEATTAARARPAGRVALRFTLLAMITALIVALLIGDLAGARSFASAVAQADFAWVLIAALISFASMALSALRWLLILRALGYRIGWLRSAFAWLAAAPLSAVMPARTNDFFRPVIVRDVVPIMIGTGSILAERALDLLVLLALAAVAAATIGLWLPAAIAAGLALLELALLWALLKHRHRIARIRLLRKRAAKISDLFRALEVLRRKPGHLAAVLSASLLVRLSTIAMAAALLAAVHANLSLSLTFGAWPLALCIGLIPITLAGMGTRDAAFVALLALAGAQIDDAAVLAATMGYSLAAYWLQAAIGAPFLVREMTRLRATTLHK